MLPFSYSKIRILVAIHKSDTIQRNYSFQNNAIAKADEQNSRLNPTLASPLRQGPYKTSVRLLASKGEINQIYRR